MSESIRRQKVIESVLIVEVIGEHLPPLRDRATLWSLCPFHDDQTHNFGLDPATRSFKCHVCGASGDLIDVIRMHDGITVSKALDLLEAMPRP